MRESDLRDIFKMTKGHCHFCGNRLKFKKYGKKSGRLVGYWEIDHVIQRARGGRNSKDNYLPICTPCNRLRSDYEGKELRKLLEYGQIAIREMKKKESDLGRAFRGFLIKRAKQEKRKT